jgi:hypothetical protein
MKQVAKLKRGYITLAREERINVWHISIYMALLYLWVWSKGVNPLYITRKKVMKLAHISSIATYHKCIKQLQEFGYIYYVPSYNRFTGTKVYLLAIQD